MDDDTASIDRKALGQAIRALRERAGLTQKQLAERAGTGHTYVSRVESGRIDAGWSTVRRLLRAVDASPRQLANALAEAEATDPARRR